MKRPTVKFAPLVFIVACFSLNAFGDLKKDFESLHKKEKGPFGLNMMQGEYRRSTYESGDFPKPLLFQAAFRNEKAKSMIRKYGFYTGNLFSTNYYELMGEYVYGDAQSNHPIMPERLNRQGSRAIEKASLIAKHWVLEKHYISIFPERKYSRSFRYRGVSGSEYEQKFARHFFDFYLSSLGDDYQYLPGFLLATQSPILESQTLARARLLISEEYEEADNLLKFVRPKVKALYRLRNEIHNRLSPDVIQKIDRFLADHPEYAEKENSRIVEIRKILSQYYAFDANNLADLARRLNSPSIQTSATALTHQFTLGNLRRLSKSAIQIKSSQSLNANSFVVLSKTSQLVDFGLTHLQRVESNLPIQIALDAVFIQGFLTSDHYEYFTEELSRNQTLEGARQIIADAVEIATDTLIESFQPAFDQWVRVEPDMAQFVDQTLKSSALQSLSSLHGKTSERYWIQK